MIGAIGFLLVFAVHTLLAGNRANSNGGGGGGVIDPANGTGTGDARSSSSASKTSAYDGKLLSPCNMVRVVAEGRGWRCRYYSSRSFSSTTLSESEGSVRWLGRKHRVVFVLFSWEKRQKHFFSVWLHHVFGEARRCCILFFPRTTAPARPPLGPSPLLPPRYSLLFVLICHAQLPVAAVMLVAVLCGSVAVNVSSVSSSRVDPAQYSYSQDVCVETANHGMWKVCVKRTCHPAFFSFIAL